MARSYNGSATLAPSICVEYRLHVPEICDDGLDNDGDGLTDCDDPDCFGREECLEICGEEGCTEIGDYGDGALCYHWEPADRVQGDASGPRVTVCPGATTTFIRTGTDENGDVKSRDEYTVTVFPLGDLTIDPEAPVFCAEPVTLTAAEGFEHYVWLDEMGNELGVGATYEATAPGVYTVEAEDAASGCLVRAGVEVSGTFEVEITASEALLCQEAATPVILDAGEGKSYEWRREGAVLGTDRTQEAAEPGLYEVTVTSLEDCVAEGEIEVGDASQADEIRDMLAAMGFYAVPIRILGDDGPVQAPKTNEELVVDEARLRIQLVDDDFNIRASLEDFLFIRR